VLGFLLGVAQLLWQLHPILLVVNYDPLKELSHTYQGIHIVYQCRRSNAIVWGWTSHGWGKAAANTTRVDGYNKVGSNVRGSSSLLH